MRTIVVALIVVLASAIATGCAYKETVVERPVASTTYVVPADPPPAAIVVPNE